MLTVCILSASFYLCTDDSTHYFPMADKADCEFHKYKMLEREDVVFVKCEELNDE